MLLATGVLAALALPGVAPAVAGAHARHPSTFGRTSHDGHRDRTQRFFGHKVG